MDAVVAHAFNPSTQEAEIGGSLRLRILVYRMSSRIARATQRNPHDVPREICLLGDSRYCQVNQVTIPGSLGVSPALVEN